MLKIAFLHSITNNPNNAPFLKLILILLLILLVGCKPMECEPVIINNTIKEIIEKEIIIYENKTMPCNTTKYEYEGTTTRELELIRRIKFLEGQQDKFINHSDCFDELNKTNNELKDCEEEICKWNSSWC